MAAPWRSMRRNHNVLWHSDALMTGLCSIINLETHGYRFHTKKPLRTLSQGEGSPRSRSTPMPSCNPFSLQSKLHWEANEICHAICARKNKENCEKNKTNKEHMWGNSPYIVGSFPSKLVVKQLDEFLWPSFKVSEQRANKQLDGDQTAFRVLQFPT